MKTADLQQTFAETGALLKGHFLLSSGLHSDQYLQCALLLAHPDQAERLGSQLAALQSPQPELVVSPAMGGLIIGHEVARALKVRHYFMERADGLMTLRRGFALKRGERVAVVEDVVTTGKSSREVFAVIEAAGAEVAGWLSIVDRSGEKAAGLKSLLRIDVPSWPQARCPLCKKGVPFVKPGSRNQPK